VLQITDLCLIMAYRTLGEQNRELDKRSAPFFPPRRRANSYEFCTPLVCGILNLLMIGLLVLTIRPANAVDSDNLLSPEQAFQLTSGVKRPDRLLLSWYIADGYYLYRHKIKLISLTPGIKVQDAVFPVGHTKLDQFFGEVEIYQDNLAVEVPLLRQDLKLKTLIVEVTFQGCANVGVCYMPVQQILTFDLSEKSFDWWGWMTSATDRFTSLP